MQLRGLYVITDKHLIPKDRFVETVEQAIIGGAQVVQYRDKSDDLACRLDQLQGLNELCQKYQVPLIVNDDYTLLKFIPAQGIHLGKEDAQVTQVRESLGDQILIGVSCYNQFSLAQRALHEGANYVAFGSFFRSSTKPHAVTAGIELLQQAKRQLSCPVVAIGGITPENGAQLIAAGADCLAVIHGVFGQPDVAEAARHYAQLFFANPE